VRIGKRELLFDGFRVSVWGEENSLEIDCSDGCATCLMSLTCKFRND
jgi:hypothetical protein